MDTNHRIRGALERDECMRLLTTKKVGRLIYTRDALPAVQPVRYLIDGECIVFGIGQSSLVRSRDGTVIAFEVDDLNAETGAGWVVTVVGQATALTAAEAEAGGYCPHALRPFNSDGAKHFVAVTPGIVTGRRFTG